MSGILSNDGQGQVQKYGYILQDNHLTPGAWAACGQTRTETPLTNKDNVQKDTS